MSKKKLLGEEEREEMYSELLRVTPGKSAREFHRKYKRYGYGLFFVDRHPRLLYILAMVISALSLVISTVQLLR